MKFILFVEGKTESQGVSGFLNRWLSLHFEPAACPGIQIRKFEGWSALHDRAPKIALNYLTDPAYADVIAVVSLLDLYGPQFYPPGITSVSDRYRWGRRYMEDRVRQHFTEHGLPEDLSTKYRHFFAVHETEAWLLTRPDLFDKRVRASLQRQKPPEQVNFDLPPGKLLGSLYLKLVKHKYNKTANARNIFRKLDPVHTSGQCPYLNEMLLELRAMAAAAGAKPRGDWAQQIDG